MTSTAVTDIMMLTAVWGLMLVLVGFDIVSPRALEPPPVASPLASSAVKTVDSVTT